MRDLLPDLLARTGVSRVFQPLTRGRAVVFMLHRFGDRSRGVRGHEREDVRRGIEYLKARGHELLPLGELFRRLRSGTPPLRRAVAFTMDDGYADQSTEALPLFAELDCPITVFVTTGFLDGALWLWWDKVEHVFLRTRESVLEVEIGGRRVRYRAGADGWQERHWAHLIEACKRVPEEEKERAIASLAEKAGVTIPESPPEPFTPMAWRDVRAWEETGLVTFGPHTVSHPILAQVDDRRARVELEASWRRLCEEAERPVPIFGYPNGLGRDYGEREIAILRELGFMGAMAAEEGHVAAHLFRRREEEAFRLPRVSYPARFGGFIQHITGIERFKELLRPAG